MKYAEIINQPDSAQKEAHIANKVRRAEIAFKTAQITTSEKLEEAKEKVDKILHGETIDVEALYKAETDVEVYERREKWVAKKLKDLF